MVVGNPGKSSVRASQQIQILKLALRVGNQDVVSFITQAINEVGVSGQMHGELGTTTCSSAEGGDKDSALVAFKISLHPPGSSSASSRYFGSGGAGLARVALGLLICGLVLQIS